MSLIYRTCSEGVRIYDTSKQGQLGEEEGERGGRRVVNGDKLMSEERRNYTEGKMARNELRRLLRSDASPSPKRENGNCCSVKVLKCCVPGGTRLIEPYLGEVWVKTKTNAACPCMRLQERMLSKSPVLTAAFTQTCYQRLNLSG